MRSLPANAQRFLMLVCVLGVAAVGVGGLCPLPQAHVPFWELPVFLLLAALAGGKKIALMRHKGEEDVCSMSLGFAITFAAILHFGPASGVFVGMTSCISGCLYPRRQPFYQMAFNIGLSTLESLVAGLTFLVLNGWTLELRPLNTFMAVVGAAIADFAINTGGVAIIMAICTEQKPARLWKETFLWTAPSYFAGACISTLAIILFGRNTAAILLFASPVAYLTYYSYAIYAARAEEKQQHIEALQREQAHLADLYLATIKSLALAIDAKDQYTHQHILRVQRYAVATAKQMGLTGADLEGINTGALLHDIGKLGVPEYVLLKPGRLTDDEFAKIRKHPEIGAAILDPVEFPWPVLPAVRHHHEKWDGTGYPDGLKGEEIPLPARILAVADVYDALTSSRSYRQAWTHEKTIAIIKKDSGTHFDPVVVEAFLAVIDGVVQEMAEEGEGPLVTQKKEEAQNPSKVAQAVRDIQRSSSELWALYEVAQTLSTSLGLQETLDILARKMQAIFPGVGCVFYIQDAQEGVLQARAAVGINQEYFAASRTYSATSRSLKVLHNRETYCGDYDADDILLSNSQSVCWEALHSALIVPIVHDGEALGTINLYHTAVNAFSLHDQQLLETIAERAAMAFRNGLLYDRTRGDALSDPLTGIHNIRYLTEYVERRCQQALRREHACEILHQDDAGPQEPSGLEPCAEEVGHSEPFALLCLDLDSFKPINDNFGHQKGDEVLRNLAKIFVQTVAPGDIVARYGGDEFLIVLEGAGQAEAEAMARKLEAVVANYDAGLLHYKLGKLQLGVSIGHACFPHEGDDCAALMAAADTQMYRKKTERKLGTLALKNAVPQREAFNMRRAA